MQAYRIHSGHSPILAKLSDIAEKISYCKGNDGGQNGLRKDGKGFNKQKDNKAIVGLHWANTVRTM